MSSSNGSALTSQGNTATNERPATLDQILISEESDPQTKKALEILQTDFKLTIEGADAKSNDPSLDEEVKKDKDAKDYSNVTLTKAEELAEVPMAPTLVSTGIKDEDDFDAPSSHTPSVNVQHPPIDSATGQEIKQMLTRYDFNGEPIVRFSDLPLLAVDKSESTEEESPITDTPKLPQQPIVVAPDDVRVFNDLPGADSAQNNNSNSIEPSTHSASLSLIGANLIGNPLISEQDLLKMFRNLHEMPMFVPKKKIIERPNILVELYPKIQEKCIAINHPLPEYRDEQHVAQDDQMEFEIVPLDHQRQSTSSSIAAAADEDDDEDATEEYSKVVDKSPSSKSEQFKGSKNADTITESINKRGGLRKSTRLQNRFVKDSDEECDINNSASNYVPEPTMTVDLSSRRSRYASKETPVIGEDNLIMVGAALYGHEPGLEVDTEPEIGSFLKTGGLDSFVTPKKHAINGDSHPNSNGKSSGEEDELNDYMEDDDATVALSPNEAEASRDGIDDAASSYAIDYHITPQTFALVQNVNWEEDILWDDQNDEADPAIGSISFRGTPNSNLTTSEAALSSSHHHGSTTEPTTPRGDMGIYSEDANDGFGFNQHDASNVHNNNHHSNIGMSNVEESGDGEGSNQGSSSAASTSMPILSFPASASNSMGWASSSAPRKGKDPSSRQSVKSKQNQVELIPSFAQSSIKAFSIPDSYSIVTSLSNTNAISDSDEISNGRHTPNHLVHLKTSAASSAHAMDIDSSNYSTNSSDTTISSLLPSTAGVPSTSTSGSSSLHMSRSKDFVIPSKPISSSIFDTWNSKLDSGYWLDAVVWDDDDSYQRRRLAPPGQHVEVDLSDTHLLFEDESVQFDAAQSSQGNEKSGTGTDDDEDSEGEGGGKKQIRKRHLQLPSRAQDDKAQLKAKQDALNQIDKFNLSRDSEYEHFAKDRRTTRVLEHSQYAIENLWLRPLPTRDQFLHYHKPIGLIIPSHQIGSRLYAIASYQEGKSRKKQKKKKTVIEVVQKKNDLSAADGRIILFEYVEEFPPYMNEIGMASRINNYRKKFQNTPTDTSGLAAILKQSTGITNHNLSHLLTSSSSSAQKTPEQIQAEMDAIASLPPNLAVPAGEPFGSLANVTTDNSLPWVDGEEVILDADIGHLPFLGDIQAGARMQAIENELYKSPIFHHPVPTTDFLLIRRCTPGISPNPYLGQNVLKKNTIAGFSELQLQVLTTFYVRRIDALYLVGQEEPKRIIPAPNSRAYNEFCKIRTQQLTYYLFAKNNNIVTLAQVRHYFSTQSEPAVRKVLKPIADYQRGINSYWELRSELNNEIPTSINEIRKMVKLEDIVSYDCQQAVAYRLEEMGIEHMQLTQVRRLALQCYQNNDPAFRVARFVGEELELASWNLTNNFVEGIQNHSIFQLRGLGDPSGKGEAFSYLKMPMKVQGLKKDKERDSGVTVTGTDADLRKLNIPTLNAKIRAEGIPDETFIHITRWQKVQLLRSLADRRKKLQAADDNNINQFARYTPHNVAAHQEAYDSKLQMIFHKQINGLRYKVEEDTAEETADMDSLFGDEDEEAQDDEERMSKRNKPSSSMDIDPTESSDARKKREQDRRDEIETERYIAFVKSLEATKLGSQDKDRPDVKDDSQDSSKDPHQQSKTSGGATLTVLVDEDTTMSVDLGGDGKPSKPGAYAKMTVWDDNIGRPKVVWSIDPKDVKLARDESAKRTAKSNSSKSKKAGSTEKATRTTSATSKMKCSSCHKIGHIRTNPICENYGLDTGAPRKNKKSSSSGGGGSKNKSSKKKKDEFDSEEEAEFDEGFFEDDNDEMEFMDSGSETDEESIMDDGSSVGIAAQRHTTEVEKVSGTKLVIQRPKATRRSRYTSDSYHFGGDDGDISDDYYDEDDYGAAPPPKKKKSAPKSEKSQPLPPDQTVVPLESPQGQFNASILEDVVDKLIDQEQYMAFRYPVDTDHYTDYSEYVSNPICMEDIQAKCQALSYTSIDEFSSDWKRIASNCAAYNGPGTDIVRVGEDLCTDALSLITERHALLLNQPQDVATNI